MELWNRARSFAEEAAKRSQDLSLGASASKFADIITETTKEIAAQASKRLPQHYFKNDVDLITFGITEELREFVRGITIATFEYFPLQDDTDLSDVPAVSNIRQDLTEWQQKHASLVLSTVKEISRLSYENRYMEEEKLKSSEQDHKVMMKSLSTELNSNQEVQEVKKETKSSKPSTEQDLDVFLLGGDSDDEPDDGDGGYDDDLDKLMDNSEKNSNTIMLTNNGD
ncbi:uncharacterized protein LOC109808686 isoform X3 [Cajanus cajan]|uniref:uncharacterized protein LOC109808686 isoform X3 n=1 Tax=Cajanus cajan TaxID=3821 RepID=UPI00098D9BF7|nr:uncharacterized protein LOC109808686 isoform X3 [Cajanus cajan]